METEFFVKLVSSFAVGAIWVAASTTIADRVGTKLGGLVAGLPSTVVVTLFFVGLTQGTANATLAASTVPIAFSINGPFLIVFCLLIRRGLVTALMGSLAPWLLLSVLIVQHGLFYFGTAITVWIATFVLTYWVLEYRLKIPSHIKSRQAPTRVQILLRALLSGTIVAAGVFFSEIGGPIFGGLFASFPAVFLSALVIAYLSGGAEFSRALAKSMMLSGFVNVVTYAIVGYLVFPLLGIWLGMMVGLLVTTGTGYLTLLVVRAKMV